MESNGIEIVNRVNLLEIYEYDIGLVDGDVYFKIEQDHYLLLNKAKMKEFYFYWRSRLFKASGETDVVTKCCLLVNPNLQTAWSRRKQLLLESSSDSVEKELQFNRLVLIKHFKCEQAFIHRRWLVRKQLESLSLSSEFIQAEIELIVDVLGRKVKSNYYCWSYLNWLLEFTHAIGGIDKLFYLELLNNKLKTAVYMNPSDFSVLHSRLNLLRMILAENLSCQLLLDELSMTEELLVRYSQFSTVWHYARYTLLIISSCSESTNWDQVLIEFESSRNELDKRLNIAIESVNGFVLSNIQSESTRITNKKDFIAYSVLRMDRLKRSFEEFESIGLDTRTSAVKLGQFLNKFVLV